MHHSIHRIEKKIVLGAYEYLERQDRKAKLESAYSFMLKYSKITVCIGLMPCHGALFSNMYL